MLKLETLFLLNLKISSGFVVRWIFFYSTWCFLTAWMVCQVSSFYKLSNEIQFDRFSIRISKNFSCSWVFSNVRFVDWIETNLFFHWVEKCFIANLMDFRRKFWMVQKVFREWNLIKIKVESSVNHEWISDFQLII
jgi:hypothetical protein